MERRLIQTADGSHSLFVPSLDEQYHSRHGAVQESRHVFIEEGLRAAAGARKQLHILEYGFGTGLNALLTATVARMLDIAVDYQAIEAYPLTADEVQALNYATHVAGDHVAADWEAIHAGAWGEWAEVHPRFRILRHHRDMLGFDGGPWADVVYYDAFAPDKQPELWTVEAMGAVWANMAEGGLLTTYCAKGDVRRAMQAAGLAVTKRPGPPGKREMLVGRK